VPAVKRASSEQRQAAAPAPAAGLGPLLDPAPVPLRPLMVLEMARCQVAGGARSRFAQCPAAALYCAFVLDDLTDLGEKRFRPG
jgi:hypothetical protein